jgi:hypothetical protein
MPSAHSPRAADPETRAAKFRTVVDRFAEWPRNTFEQNITPICGQQGLMCARAG